MAKKIQYHFVLSKEDENSGLKAHLDGLAAEKQLTAKIKTALTLLAQLENGNTELLDSMFPEMRCIEPPEPPPAPPSQDDLQRIITDAVQIGVEKAIENFPGLPAGRLVAEPAYKEAGQGVGAASRTIAAALDDDEAPPPRVKLAGLTKGSKPIFEPPPDEDDTIVLTKKEGDMTSTMNFLASFGAAMGMDVGGHVPPDA